MTAHQNAPQLGFDALLVDADTQNRKRKIERETAHMPNTMDEAIPFYRELIKQHHTAMLSGDIEQVHQLVEEAHNLARRLNNGEPGILGGEDAPGNVLTRKTAASEGALPKWGQQGSFAITICGMNVRIEIDGMFGIGSGHCFWPGFSAHAVDWSKPFLSETGYRSFLGIYAAPQSGLQPDVFTAKIIDCYVGTELKGRLLKIADQYRERHAELS